MKATNLVLIGFLLSFCNCIYAQHITEQLKQFHENADMDCYLTKIQKNVNDFFVIETQMFGGDKYGIQPRKIEIQKEKIVSMLTIQFINTESFNLNDDIYNYITIDSSVVFTLACVDKKMNVTAFANFFDGLYGYYEISKDPSIENFCEKMKFKHIIKNINKQKPEFIIYCNSLRGSCDNNGFMYIKNGKIYVYRVIEKDVYELNDYIRRFFSLDRIRKLNYNFIPLIYQLDLNPSSRRTGHTPKNEIMICQ